MLVSVIVAARRDLVTVNSPGDGERLRLALEALGNLTPSTLIAVKVVWTPSDPDDRMTTVEAEQILKAADGTYATITGAVTAPVYSPGTAFPADSSTAWAFEPPGRLDFAPQLGTTLLIQEGDSRFQNLVVRNGSLWGCHTIFLPTGTPTRASAQWWQVSPGGTVIQRGRIDDTNGLAHFSFPSIAVNARGEPRQ